MIRRNSTTRQGIRRLIVALATLASVAGCNSPNTSRLQGYVEGEFVYVASPLAGTLETLSVQRGAQVLEVDPLFALDSAPEVAGRDEATRRLAQARANLEDLKKGRRPTEIESLEAQLKQAQAARDLSEKLLARQEKMMQTNATSAQDYQRASATFDQDRQRVVQIEAELKTAKLPARDDQITAAEELVRALEAMLAKAEWDLSQKRQVAPQRGLVYDTLFRSGEWVAAGKPVVVLLPPQNIKVRTFVPEEQVGSIHPGDRVQVYLDGVSTPFAGKVSFISPKAEFTPPVIYSRESRSKLVFMVEAVFDMETAAKMHPGQPVEVEFIP